MGFNCSSDSTPDSGIMRMGRGGLPSYSKSMVNALGSNATFDDKYEAGTQSRRSVNAKDDKKTPYLVSKMNNINNNTVGVGGDEQFMYDMGYSGDFGGVGRSPDVGDNQTQMARMGFIDPPDPYPVSSMSQGISDINRENSLYYPSNTLPLGNDSSSKSSGDKKVKSSSTPKTNERSFFNRMTDINNDGNVGFLETMAMMSGISPFIGAASYGYDALKNSGLGGFRTSDQSNNASSTYGGSIDPTSTEYQKLVEQQETYLAKKKAENDGKDGLYNLFGLQSAEDQAANIMRSQEAIERSKNKKDKKPVGIETIADEVSDDTMINPETGEAMTRGTQYIKNPLSLEEWLASQGYTMADYGIKTGTYQNYIEKPNTYMAHGGPANPRYMSKGGPTMFAWTDEAKSFINDLIDNKGYTAQEANDHIWEVMPRSFINKYERKSMGGLPRQPSGEVKGPGGPKDDLVGPILLSNKEYVMPIEQVKMAGGGNYQTGINRLEKDRKNALQNYS
jgi:hypothetical protein